MVSVLLSFLVLLVANADIPGSCGVSKPLFKVSCWKLISLDAQRFSHMMKQKTLVCCINIVDIYVPVVPHNAVAEVSK